MNTDSDPSHIATQTLDKQLTAVSENGWLIRYIRHPSKPLQLAAIHNDPWTISLIESPSVDVQLEAIKIDPYVVECIDHPDGSALAYAESQKLLPNE